MQALLGFLFLAAFLGSAAWLVIELLKPKNIKAALEKLGTTLTLIKAGGGSSVKVLRLKTPMKVHHGNKTKLIPAGTYLAQTPKGFRFVTPERFPKDYKLSGEGVKELDLSRFSLRVKPGRSPESCFHPGFKLQEA